MGNFRELHWGWGVEKVWTSPAPPIPRQSRDREEGPPEPPRQKPVGKAKTTWPLARPGRSGDAALESQISERWYLEPKYAEQQITAGFSDVTTAI